MATTDAASRFPIPIAPDRVGAVADAITRGFIDNETWVWIVPPRWRLERLMRHHYRAMIRHIYNPLGSAWTTPNAAGGALWFPPGRLGRRRSQQARELVSLLPWIGLGGLRRGIAFEQLQQRHHPKEPHWYLQTLSIDPSHQRSGYGTALMQPALERCDAERMPAYLETQREASIPYYRRFGFDVVDKVSVDDSPPLWLMWRPAGAG